MRIALIVAIVVAVASTAVVEFFVLLYKPDFVWYLVAGLTLAYYALLWKRQRFRSAVVIGIQVAIGLLVSYDFFWAAIEHVQGQNPISSMAYGIAYFAAAFLLLWVTGVLAGKLRTGSQSARAR